MMMVKLSAFEIPQKSHQTKFIFLFVKNRFIMEKTAKFDATYFQFLFYFCFQRVTYLPTYLPTYIPTYLPRGKTHYIVFLTYFFKKWTNPASFSFIFGLLKQTLQFLQQIYVKNVHPVYGTGIQTYDLWDMSLFP